MYLLHEELTRVRMKELHEEAVKHRHLHHHHQARRWARRAERAARHAARASEQAHIALGGRTYRRRR
jgi:hypothetical protein